MRTRFVVVGKTARFSNKVLDFQGLGWGSDLFFSALGSLKASGAGN
jgi:hypothetical protein